MTNPTHSGPPELRTVVTLLLTNLGLSAVIAALLLVFRQALLDYQLDRMAVPAADRAATAAGLESGTWSRVIGVVVVGVVCAFLVRGLRQGRRRAWFRLLAVSTVGPVGILAVLATGQYPMWVDVEQVVQAGVLVALLWAATRPAVRAHFARRTQPA